MKQKTLKNNNDERLSSILSDEPYDREGFDDEKDFEEEPLDTEEANAANLKGSQQKQGDNLADIDNQYARVFTKGSKLDKASTRQYDDLVPKKNGLQLQKFQTFKVSSQTNKRV